MLYREIIAVCSQIHTKQVMQASLLQRDSHVLVRLSVMETCVIKVTGLMEEIGLRTENLGEASTKHHASSP